MQYALHVSATVTLSNSNLGNLVILNVLLVPKVNTGTVLLEQFLSFMFLASSQIVSVSVVLCSAVS